MNTFDVEIVTPSGSRICRGIRSANLPGREGRLTVLAGHEPLLCALNPGRAELEDAPGNLLAWDIGQGTLMVKDHAVTLLVKTADAIAPGVSPL